LHKSKPIAQTNAEFKPSTARYFYVEVKNQPNSWSMERNFMSRLSPFAGKLPEATDLIHLDDLCSAYETLVPDPSISEQRISFGTSGHRGTSLATSFNRTHILAMTQAICLYRKMRKVTGPLILGYDTHALSLLAFRTALEVLAANGVEVLIAEKNGFMPTPVVSHAILTYNRQRSDGCADGIVVTPSHNPPQDGGFKYNPVHGGPAEKEITDWIQTQANAFLQDGLKGVQRIPFERALKASTTHHRDFITPYVHDLANVLDMDIIRDSGLSMGVDPMGGAGVHYWEPIADRYKLKLSILNPQVDPAFPFVSRDWDGQIRMDPSSKFAMRSLIEKGRTFDVAFACDTDYDRHGIVTKTSGLMPSNDYLATAIFYLFSHRPQWGAGLKIGKTVVSTQVIDRVGKSLGREVYEVPVGFKWFVEGLYGQGSAPWIGFCGEESAGATYLRKDGQTWTTDKDGFVAALLSAEMTARLGKDPAQIFASLTRDLGTPFNGRIDAKATAAQRARMGKLTVQDVNVATLAGDPVIHVTDRAGGNGAGIGGIKLVTKNGWAAFRPSGTEDIYKIYGESFVSAEHLERIFSETQEVADKVLTTS
jgi:phosphoglucomutase